MSNFVYPVSLLLILALVHYHVRSKIDIKSFLIALHGLSYWGESMKEKIWDGYVARTGEKRVHIVFLCASVNRPLVGPRRRWEDNINMDFKVIMRHHVDWFNLAENGGQVVGCC